MKKRKSRNQIFVSNPETLQEMFSLRINGWSITALAEKYKVDRKTICDRCIANRIFPIKPVKLGRPRLRKFEHLDEYGDKINQGHNYEYYLKLSTRK